MPQLGETVVEGTIIRWLKKEGDSVEADESLLEISTDKVDSEIPSPASGVVSKIHAKEGETVKVGSVLAEIGDEGQAAGPAAEPKEEAGEPPAAEQPEPAAEAEVPAAEDKPPAARAEPKKPDEFREPEKADPVKEAPPAAERPSPKEAPPSGRPEPTKKPAPAAKVEPEVPLESTAEEPRRGILSPLVRKLAGEHRVDLRAVKGSGAGGRITKQDVLRFAETGMAAAPALEEAAAARPAEEVPAGAGEEVVQIGHMRKAIADHMLRSTLATARAWNAVEVDMSKVARLRELAGPMFRQRESFSLTWMPFIGKAVAQGLLRYPQVNSAWNDDGTITRKYYVNLGIAVALEGGLIVPVIKGADGMNVPGLARRIRDIADRARSKKLSPDEVHGGTFTITNPGPFGSIMSVPIINQGQTGILAVDAVTKRAVVVTDELGNDSIAVRQMVFLSMSWDHRLIDGAEAAQFLAHLKQLLEEADFASDLSAYLPPGE
jgi:2-oxoglutarate dehydrogenase E2 component (dihydrolipoamide succinyltransferase)